MKQILILILTVIFLSNCDRNKSNKVQSEFKQKIELETLKIINQRDTIKNYWELILDTISSKKEFNISNFKYVLELKTYSLNDSSIVRNLNQEGENEYLDFSHKMVTDFKLLSNSTIDKKQIDRTDFEKYLTPEFYKECNLFSTEIDSIKGNTIYLTSDLSVPDTDNQWRVWFSIKINKNSLGILEIKEVDYVGN